MIRAQIETPAGFTYNIELDPGCRVIGMSIDHDAGTLAVNEPVPGDDDLALAAALVSELADLSLTVLTAEVRGVPMSAEWLDEHAANR